MLYDMNETYYFEKKSKAVSRFRLTTNNWSLQVVGASWHLILRKKSAKKKGFYLAS